MKKRIAIMVLSGAGFAWGAMGQAAMAAVGDRAPAPVLLTLSGDSYKFMSEFYYEGKDRPRGRRSAVVLCFMGQDSAASGDALPRFMAVAQKVQSHPTFRGQARFFLVSTDPLSQKDGLPGFMARHGVGLPVDVLLDPQRKACQEFGVEELPRTFVISRSGRIVADIRGVGGDYAKALATGIVKAVNHAETAPKPIRSDSVKAVSGRSVAAEDANIDPDQPMRW